MVGGLAEFGLAVVQGNQSCITGLYCEVAMTLSVHWMGVPVSFVPFRRELRARFNGINPINAAMNAVTTRSKCR
jgi:hypothetical protein